MKPGSNAASSDEKVRGKLRRLSITSRVYWAAISIVAALYVIQITRGSLNAHLGDVWEWLFTIFAALWLLCSAVLALVVASVSPKLESALFWSVGTFVLGPLGAMVFPGMAQMSLENTLQKK